MNGGPRPPSVQPSAGGPAGPSSAAGPSAPPHPPTGMPTNNGQPLTPQQQAALQQRALLNAALGCTNMAIRLMAQLETPLPSWFTSQTMPNGAPNPSYLTIGLGEGVAPDGSSGGKRLEAWKLWLPVLQTGNPEQAFQPAFIARFCTFINLSPVLSAPTPIPQLATATPEQLARAPATDLPELFRETFENFFGETQRRRAANMKQQQAARALPSANGAGPASVPAPSRPGGTFGQPSQAGQPQSQQQQQPQAQAHQQQQQQQLPHQPPPPLSALPPVAVATPPPPAGTSSVPLPSKSTTPSDPPPPSLLVPQGGVQVPQSSPIAHLQSQSQPQLMFQGPTPSPALSSKDSAHMPQSIKPSASPQPHPQPQSQPQAQPQPVSGPSSRPTTSGGAPSPLPPAPFGPPAPATAPRPPTSNPQMLLQQQLLLQRQQSLHGPSTSAASTPPTARAGPTYIPLQRGVVSHGGWDVDKLQAEQHALSGLRAPARVGMFGTLDLDALAMSIRSRLHAEVGYALQVVEMLAGEYNTRAGGEADGILPMEHCMELWEELVVLLEETAFGEDGLQGVREREAATALVAAPSGSSQRQRKLSQSDLAVRANDELAYATILDSFGAGSSAEGTRPTRRTKLILKVVGILRDLSLQRENLKIVSFDFNLLEILLLLCRPSSAGLSASPETGLLVASDTDEDRLLSVFDLLAIRQDTLHILATIALDIPLTARSCPPSLLPALVEFLASYINDPSVDLYPPGSSDGHRANEKVMLSAAVIDMAVDAFSQLTVLDANRALLASSVPEDDLVALYDSLARALPLADADFVWLQIPRWSALSERIALSLYSLAFASTPSLKARLRQSRSSQQVIPHVFRSILRQGAGRPFGANVFAVLARRLAEVLGQLDDRDDDEAVSLSFGSGFGEAKSGAKRKRKEVRGGSWLAGEDRLWTVLMTVVECDEVAWEELEQLYFCT